MKKEWTLKSWKEYKAAQQPDWETAKNYSSVIKKQNVLNIDFLDIGGLYKKKQGGVITNCCGETLQLQYLYHSFL